MGAASETGRCFNPKWCKPDRGDDGGFRQQLQVLSHSQRVGDERRGKLVRDESNEPAAVPATPPRP